MKKINQPKPLNSVKDQVFARKLIQVIAESFLIQGHIKIEDFSDRKKLLEKIIKLLPKNDEDLFFTIIHQPTFLKEGYRYVKQKNYSLAYVFYAIYFEHFINEILDMWFKRNLIEYKIYSSLIRRVNLEDKYTWVLGLLKLPKFKEIHWKTIKTISDKRNSFIHYKYNSEPADAPIDTEKVEWKNDYKGILKAITYTRRYRTQMVFGGKKKTADIFRRLSKL